MSNTLDHERITNYLFERGHTVSKPMVNDVLALITEARIKSAQHQRNLVIQQGHNLDCIQCGFKDAVVERYLTEVKENKS